jgi:ABC-type bacteriocin/lantibiotic exporter with double-glycine peptidase domain
MQYLDARNRHFSILKLQYHVLVIFKTVITAAMLIVGTLLLVNQQINIGQFIAAEIIILLVLNSVEKLIMNMGSVYDTLTSVEKIGNLTDKPKEKKGSVVLADTGKGLQVEMKNLSFSYNDESDVLSNINVQINANEKVCIQGKDSSGKSTLLKVLAGAYTGFDGSMMINDVPLGNYSLDSVRSQIGVLINQQDIFNGTVWENISLGNESISMQTVVDLAAKTGLNDFIATLKNGYDTMLDPAGKRLSHNVVHKILLVRALAGKPRLLLLEEPWQQGEKDYREQIFQLLTEIENTTLVVVSNDAAFAGLCDKVIIIDEGKIVNQSTINAKIN